MSQTIEPILEAALYARTHTHAHTETSVFILRENCNALRTIADDGFARKRARDLLYGENIVAKCIIT